MAARGTAWDHPYGPDSSLEGLDLLPVVHISYTDAVEYCAWADMRLPTEKEWEYAARGGRVNQTFPWGDKYEPGRMNIWDGKDFPNKNALDDGFYGPAPVKTFPPNDYGVYNLLGKRSVPFLVLREEYRVVTSLAPLRRVVQGMYGSG